MQSHDDRDFEASERIRKLFAKTKFDSSDEWMRSLEKKAEAMHTAGKSKITGGEEGEESLAEWQHKSVHVRHMPEDEHGILRVSVGGGENIPIKLDYCVFRGNRGQCIDLLRRALKALESR